MTWIKAYDWEHETFPKEKNIEIKYEYRKKLCEKLAKYFGLNLWRVETTSRGGANAWEGLIQFPSRSYKCDIGMIYHELAHIFDRQKNNHKGHTGSFKKSLIKIYVESKSQLPRIFNEIRKEQTAEMEKANKEAQKQIRIAEQKVQMKEFKKTREYKMQRLRERIKHLESKQKRIDTILKSAIRSLKAYERIQMKITPTITQTEEISL